MQFAVLTTPLTDSALCFIEDCLSPANKGKSNEGEREGYVAYNSFASVPR